MARRTRKDAVDSAPADPPGVRLPRNALARLNIGQSFAEYDDPALSDPYVYVQTPAISSATDPDSGKYFFVGRRGTGKTALRIYCEEQLRHSRVIVPEIFSPTSAIFELDLFDSTKKGPFRSLVSVMKRTLIDELLLLWEESHSRRDLPKDLGEELNGCQDDFDERTLKYIAEAARVVRYGDDASIAALNQPTKTLTNLCKFIERGNADYLLLIDSIDDFWDGSDLALIYLTAFIHACLEVSTQIPWARAILLLRENIFERVRARDPESSRVETSLIGLDWTDHQLLELIERRLNKPLITRFSLGGATWNAFFEDPARAKSDIFDYCHNRPRDILIYVSHAIDMAHERHHRIIQIEDVDSARRRFSDNRFKDLVQCSSLSS